MHFVCVERAAYKTPSQHLFNVSIENGPQLRESDAVIAGDDLGTPVDTPFGRVGLQICYDLRFPAQAQHQRAAGADILTYPSAFTVPTGSAHWGTAACFFCPLCWSERVFNNQKRC